MARLTIKDYIDSFNTENVFVVKSFADKLMCGTKYHTSSLLGKYRIRLSIVALTPLCLSR